MEIRSAVLDAILEHALQELPVECCGLLVGSSLRIECAVRARNTVASPTRYEVDPVGHFAAIRRARADGLRVVGAYHSHPKGPPIPSETDLAKVTYTDYLYLIVSPAGGRVGTECFGVYCLEQDRFERISLAVI